MKENALIIGSLFGSTAVIFGAFGAHALKKIMNADQLQSFETAVKYQMYHALLLIALGLSTTAESTMFHWAIRCLIIGVLLFSFSIYGLSISSAQNRKIKILGPITPLGGLFLVLGWILLLFHFLSLKS